jgi:hypothetical protein
MPAAQPGPGLAGHRSGVADPAASRDAPLLRALEQAVANHERRLGPDMERWRYGQAGLKHIRLRHPLPGAGTPIPSRAPRTTSTRQPGVVPAHRRCGGRGSLGGHEHPRSVGRPGQPSTIATSSPLGQRGSISPSSTLGPKWSRSPRRRACCCRSGLDVGGEGPTQWDSVTNPVMRRNTSALVRSRVKVSTCDRSVRVSRPRSTASSSRPRACWAASSGWASKTRLG